MSSEERARIIDRRDPELLANYEQAVEVINKLRAFAQQHGLADLMVYSGAELSTGLKERERQWAGQCDIKLNERNVTIDTLRAHQHAQDINARSEREKAKEDYVRQQGVIKQLFALSDDSQASLSKCTSELRSFKQQQQQQQQQRSWTDTDQDTGSNSNSNASSNSNSNSNSNSRQKNTKQSHPTFTNQRKRDPGHLPELMQDFLQEWSALNRRTEPDYATKKKQVFHNLSFLVHPDFVTRRPTNRSQESVHNRIKGAMDDGPVSIRLRQAAANLEYYLLTQTTDSNEYTVAFRELIRFKG